MYCLERLNHHLKYLQMKNILNKLNIYPSLSMLYNKKIRYDDSDDLFKYYENRQLIYNNVVNGFKSFNTIAEEEEEGLLIYNIKNYESYYYDEFDLERLLNTIINALKI